MPLAEEHAVLLRRALGRHQQSEGLGDPNWLVEILVTIDEDRIPILTGWVDEEKTLASTERAGLDAARDARDAVLSATEDDCDELTAILEALL